MTQLCASRQEGVMTATAIVALGGNALTRPDQAGTYEEKLANACEMADAICTLRDEGWEVVLVHGNGPQVGNLAIQQHEARELTPAQPLGTLGAMTQGDLGGLIARAIDARCGADIAVAVITHVVVDQADPAFADPSKPIGRFFDATEAEQLQSDWGWTMHTASHHGYRRVVASPQPLRLVEIDAIRGLIAAGHVVVAAGGGGIPVTADHPAGRYRGVDAVVDKDRTAQLLATSLPAEALLLVTEVATVMLDFDTPEQRPLHRVTASETQRYYDEGQFPAGSMGPKVEAALRFLHEGGRVCAITTAELLAATLADAGDTPGTRIERTREVQEAG
jgi:carbamate kinase